MRIVLLGAPGAIARVPGSVHHGKTRYSADLHRRHAACGDQGGYRAGPQAKAVMDAGQLVSDDIIHRPGQERISATGLRQRLPADGFPAPFPGASHEGCRCDRGLRAGVRRAGRRSSSA